MIASSGNSLVTIWDPLSAMVIAYLPANDHVQRVDIFTERYCTAREHLLEYTLSKYDTGSPSISL